ncbi:choice-of-anchor Q domain-containing protein [Runella sp.]|uniref:choice-of-anchor Q domain-containing protein n=1 Tax=Runella sp. TaxID=1960881 RepID=UPI003D104DE1
MNCSVYSQWCALHTLPPKAAFRSFTRFVLLLLASCLTGLSAQATVYHVKTDGNDTNAGTSWSAPFKTLQNALATATAGDQIWVAKGTYYPDEGPGTTNNSRFFSFIMREGVKIYGGFPTTGTPTMNERDWKAHETILSGDIDQNDQPNFVNYDNNSYHVIYNGYYYRLTSAALLDGFTVEGGNINDVGTNGAGMSNNESSPSVINCSFVRNQDMMSTEGGAGMYNNESSPSVINCSFWGNRARGAGGMYNVFSSPSVINCSFWGNQSTHKSGGMYNSYSSPTLVNCSFAGNTGLLSGGIYNFSASNPILKNCILWGNSSEVYNNNSNPVFIKTLVHGQNVGGFTGNEDPLFVHLPDFNNAPTTAGDLRLQPCSPLINQGDNSLIPMGITMDVDNNPRIQFTTVDLGAYERQSITQVLYVKTDGNDTNTGTSWQTPFKTLQKALQAACAGTQIWVAKGTYYPDEGPGMIDNNRNQFFVMVEGVKIYGGFPTTGTPTMNERDWKTHQTILSGDIDQNDQPNFGNYDNNSYHVIYNYHYSNDIMTSDALLDGFRVQGGNANYGSYDFALGGGMYNQLSNPTVVNCSFVENMSRSDGGGMFNYGSNPNIINCSFTGNRCNEISGYGGGISNRYSKPTLTNCSISGNIAVAGAGIYNWSASPILTNCSISGNRGDGMFNDNFPYEPGLYPPSNPILKNCILWGNSTEVVDYHDSNPVYIKTLVRGQNVGGFTGNEDPLFVNPPDFNNAPTTAGDLRLQLCSPVINAGNNSVFAAGQTPDLSSITTDVDNNPRIQFTGVDLGAYEQQNTPPSPLYVKTDGNDTNTGTSWQTPFKTLQKALQAACAGTQIWVAKGTYYPDEGPGMIDNNRNQFFVMKEGVKIYGGFPTTGTPTMNERDWKTHQTILSGDIDQNDQPDFGNYHGNSYHVIYNHDNGLTSAALLDGFTVEGGNTTSGGAFGGGMYNARSSPSVINCSFVRNQAAITTDGGAGMYNESSSPSVINCSFWGNSASGAGGMHNFFSSPSVINCSFWGNQSTFISGGMYNYYSSPTLVNCSFAGNTGFLSGGICNEGSNPILKNCILWGNSVEVYNYNSTPVYIKTLVRGQNVGGFTGSEAPLFVNPPDFNNAPTTAGDLRLQLCSPVINAGDNSVFAAGQTPDLSSITTDVDNKPRIQFTGVDLGAYEYQAASPSAITPTVNVISPTTCGGTNGSITLSGFLANTVYAVSYTKGAVNVAAANFTSNANGVITLTNLTAGSYTEIVAVYGACVCNAVSATLSDPAKPTLTVGAISAICAGTNTFSIPFTNPVGSPNLYSISGAGITGVTNGNLTGPITVQLSSGASGSSISFTLTVKNETTGCVSENITGSVTINPLPPTPTIAAGSATTFCAGGLVSLTSSSASGNQWYKNGNLLNGAINSIYSANTSGSYTVIVTALGCSSAPSTATIVTVNSIPTATMTGTSTVCKDATAPDITFTGSGGTAPYTFTYTLNTSNNLTVTTTNGNSVTYSQTTNVGGVFAYTLVSVSDNNHCTQAQTGSATVTVLAPSTPASPTGTTISLGQSATLTAGSCSGEGFTLLWYKSLDNTSVTMPVSPVVTTSYYARCQQSSGQTNCLSSKTADVTVTVGQRIFVNAANVNLTQDGTSWQKAFANLQAALTAARNSIYSPLEIWIAQGTYIPGTQRKDAFEIPSGVQVYGGFVGTETELSQRNWKTNKTILSGEIGTTNSLNDNINHVVVFNATNADTRLDGLTIEKGYADFVTGNQTTELTEPAILSSGGGILVINRSLGLITNCIVTNNRAITGGGLLLQDSSKVSITKTIIWGNEATFGGGVYVLGGSMPRLENLLIVTNKALGGGLYINHSQPLILHATIAANQGNGGTAGGIFTVNSATIVRNSILWGNSSPQTTDAIGITYSIVEGGYVGLGNSSQNPLFVNAGSNGLAPLGGLGDYHLQNCSPAINSGDNTGAPMEDLDGTFRPYAGVVDKGAYESQSIGSAGPATLSVTENISSGNVQKTAGKITAINQVSGGVVEYRGGESVTLLPGFSASNAVFQALISGCQTNILNQVLSDSQK